MGHQFKDCCYTCWFNRKNGDRAGYPQNETPEPAYCELRRLAIRDPLGTFCGNHPLRYPEKLPLPVGPVYRLDGWGVRRVWRSSPDSDAIRGQLLKLLEEMPAQPRPEYPFGVPFDEIVIWQMGQFKDPRAIPALKRVLNFDSNCCDEIFGLNRFMTIRTAWEALREIQAEAEQQQADQAPKLLGD